MITKPRRTSADSTPSLLKLYRRYLALDDTDEDDLRSFLSIAQRLISRGALPSADAEAITRYIDSRARAESLWLGELEPEEDGNGEDAEPPGF